MRLVRLYPLGTLCSALAAIAAALPYRDFITVGLLLTKMRDNPQANSARADHMPPDNWIYIQEPDVEVGRLQIFNNWSPYMVKNPDNVWIGMEYFVNEGDSLWTMNDESFKTFAIQELASIGIIHEDDVLDSIVIRVPKAYPAYTGEGYDRLSEIRGFLDSITNLYLIGRNGMHRYNNQDHSMLTALEAVRLIREGSIEKDSIWNVNAEQEYHEEKK